MFTSSSSPTQIPTLSTQLPTLVNYHESRSIIDQQKSTIDNQISNCLNRTLSHTFRNSIETKRKSSIFDSLSLFDQTTSSSEVDQTLFSEETNHLVLELKWSERDLIILHLNQLSASFFTNLTPEHKKTLIKENNDLLILLSSLQLANLEELHFVNESRKRTKTSSCLKIERSDEQQSNEPTLQLSWTTRLKLIDHLIVNKNLTLLRSDSINKMTKNRIMNSNNHWVSTMQSLPVGIILVDDEDDEQIDNNESMNNVFDQLMLNYNQELINHMKKENVNVFGSHSSDQKEMIVDDNEIPSINNSSSNQSIRESSNDSCVRNSNVDDFKNNTDLIMNQLNAIQSNLSSIQSNERSDLSSETEDDRQKSSASDLFQTDHCSASTSATFDQNELTTNESLSNSLDHKLASQPHLTGEFDQHRSQAEFTVKITDFEFFLTTNKRITSEKFYCQGVPWNLSLRNKNCKQVRKIYRYMDFNLHCLSIEKGIWKIDVDFEIRCLTQSENAPNIVKHLTHTFGPRDLSCITHNFISYSLMLDALRKDYVSNNTIYFQVFMKANKVIRN